LDHLPFCFPERRQPKLIGILRQISMVMDKFETQFSDLDVQTSYMEGAMSSTTAMTTPQDQVDLLINQVADEAGLERQHELVSKVPDGNVKEQEPIASTPVREEDGRLAERLRALRVSSVNATMSMSVDTTAKSTLRQPAT
jgi:division protein CdvB (Snf7/Vps24/ESCRT-III family)